MPNGFQQYLLGLPQDQFDALYNQFTQAKPEPFSGAKRKHYGTMGIATPQDQAFAQKAQEVASNVGKTVYENTLEDPVNRVKSWGTLANPYATEEEKRKARDYVAPLPINPDGTFNEEGLARAGGAVLGTMGNHNPFFSKLENVVGSKMGGKSNIDDLIRMAKNNGVSDAEINATIGGMKGVISKPEAMGLIKERTPELKDVVLGDKQNLKRYVVKEADDTYGASSRLFDTLDEAKVYYNYHTNSGTDNPLGLHVEPYILGKTTPTHFSQYTEPGGVEGSYREMFVTAGKNTTPESRRITELANLMEEEEQSVGRGTNKYAALKKEFDNLIAESHSNVLSLSWRDGHSQYSDIQNPIVRIRFNDRDVDGKKVLFVEEMQGPHAEQQKKMPSELKDRIYDIGTKRVLNYAKENGYDGVAWTKGDMQSKRYDLSKQLDKIMYSPYGDGTYEIAVIDKQGNEQTRLLPKSRVTEQEISDIAGKEIAKKIANNDGKYHKDSDVYELSGLDLQVGGEGLKSLYDKTLPTMFKKYGKEPVSTIELNPTKTTWGIKGSDYSSMRFDDLEKAMMHARNLGSEVVPYETLDAVHYIPITDKTPDSFPLYTHPAATAAAVATAAYLYGNQNDRESKPVPKSVQQMYNKTTDPARMALLEKKYPELKIEARENGGPMRAGKPYLVGENGPEIVVPKENGYVIPNNNLRPNGTPKGYGYFGKIPMLNDPNKSMTEITIGLDELGDIPLVVPTLTAEEIDYLRRGNKPTKEMVNKAADHAIMRRKQGLSPYYD